MLLRLLSLPSHIYYPSNAHSDREHKVEKVIEGRVTKKKKSFCKEIKESVVGEDVSNVKSYIIWDVLIPAIKSTIVDMVTGGIETLFYGSAKSSSRRNSERKNSYVSYNSMYDNRNSSRGREETLRKNKTTTTFDEFIFESRTEAETVLGHLVDLIEDYGMVSVADFYELIGETSTFTDNKYGWVNLANATTSRVRGGYVIDLPRPVNLD